MPVGTQATVKALAASDLRALGAQVLLGNTYHLALRPGAAIIERLGGLHRFMGWPGAILTDSGGFQVFSLAARRNVDEDGVTFRSHIDGSEQRFTPERAMAVQAALGSDIAMAFDECPASDAPLEVVREAVDRTTRWARRCLAAPRPAGQLRFGIVQGGVDLPACAGRTSPRWRRCRSRAWPWAAWAWASRRRSCTRWWPRWPPRCPRIGRAT